MSDERCYAPGPGPAPSGSGAAWALVSVSCSDSGLRIRRSAVDQARPDRQSGANDMETLGLACILPPWQVAKDDLRQWFDLSNQPAVHPSQWQ